MTTQKNKLDKKLEELSLGGDVWETGELGNSIEYAKVAEGADSAIDAAVGLLPISIRLEKRQVGLLKKLAELDGIGYQPLIRKVLDEFVRANASRLKETQSYNPQEITKLIEDRNSLREQLEKLEAFKNIVETTGPGADLKKAIAELSIESETLYKRVFDIPVVERPNDVKDVQYEVTQHHKKLREYLKELPAKIDTLSLAMYATDPESRDHQQAKRHFEKLQTQVQNEREKVRQMMTDLNASIKKMKR